MSYLLKDYVGTLDLEKRDDIQDELIEWTNGNDKIVGKT